MIQSLLLKNLIPFALGAVIGVSTIIGLEKATKQEIKLSCPEAKVTVACNHKEQAPQGLDIEKLKNVKGRIEIHNHYTVEMQGDSTIVGKIGDEIDRRNQKLRIARCR